LFFIYSDSLFKRHIPKRLYKIPRRRKITRDKTVCTGGSLPGNPGQFPVYLNNSVTQSILRQFDPVAAKSAGVYNVGTRLYVFTLYLCKDIRVFHHPKFRTNALGHASFLQLCTGGSI
jgi:hypothetical protein